MSAYNGKSKRIKNALVTILTAITYDAGSGAESAFVQVLDSQAGEFNGYPSLRILPADMSTEKASVSQNDRTVSFIVRVHLPLEAITGVSETAAQAESRTINQMYDLTDLIIDTLDEGDFSGAVNTTDPTIGTYIMNAARGDWSTDDSSAGAILLCDVNVGVSYTKNL